MESKSIGQSFLIVGVLVIALLIAISMFTDPQGGIAALVPFLTIALTLFAVVAPKAGLFALVPVVIWVDELKRLAVYFGGAYSTTVIQTLAMPLVILAGINVGFLLNILFGRIKLDRLGWFLYFLGPIIGLFIFVATEGSFSVKGQRAANVGMYMTLVPMLGVYLRGPAEWRKYIAVQVAFALPAAIWAIKQFYFGFDRIEWAYAASGLSRVHYAQMFTFNNPRVFGFFGSASALGCIGLYCAFAWWQGIHSRAHRLIWISVACLLTFILFLTTQRTALAMPAIILFTAIVYRSQLLTVGLYLTGSTLLFLGILFSDYILAEGLEKTNQFLMKLSSSSWAQDVLRVSTFSDRMRGWQRLKDPASWSWFGTGDATFGIGASRIDVGAQEYNHDVVNRILINYGAVGLLALLIPILVILFILHKGVWRLNKDTGRPEAAFALAMVVPVFVLSFLAGDNFNTNPFTIQVWSVTAGVLVYRNVIVEKSTTLRRNTAPLRDRRTVWPQAATVREDGAT